MNFFKSLATTVAVLCLFTSCSNNDDIKTVPVADYATQYNTDILKIEQYLKTHALAVSNTSGFSTDQDVTITEVSNLSSESIWGSDNTTPKASLLIKNATVGGVVHKIYYLKFREGTGNSPTVSSEIRAYYKGQLLNNSVFDMSPQTGSVFALNFLIQGWKEILPEFKMGDVIGTNQYENFGAGIMFLPSALAYYNVPNAQIPAYSPLIFSFKLYTVTN